MPQLVAAESSCKRRCELSPLKHHDRCRFGNTSDNRVDLAIALRLFEDRTYVGTVGNHSLVLRRDRYPCATGDPFENLRKVDRWHCWHDSPRSAYKYTGG